MQARVLTLLLAALMVPVLGAQTPRPFPTPEDRTGAPAQAPVAEPAPPAAPTTVEPLPTLPADPSAPSDASLGMPIYPAAQFIGSYDAGRGQRYYVFGTTATFESIVAYYRTQLDERGDRVFDEPPTHVFEFGRFDDETMSFPPGVTVKDWTWGGSPGYPNPAPNPEFGMPDRFPTVFVMVPAPTPLG